jgi:hypothetical protein
MNTNTFKKSHDGARYAGIVISGVALAVLAAACGGGGGGGHTGVTASFTASTLAPAFGQEVSFSPSMSGVGGTATFSTVTWTFGDSTSATLTSNFTATQYHTYTSTTASYTVTLSVWDNDGHTATFARVVSVSQNGGQTFPGTGTTRIGSDGVILDTQGGTWSDSGTSGAGTNWDCVRVNATGKMWEVKINNTSDLRHYTKTFKFDNASAGGDPNNAEQYSINVNAKSGAALCGYRDWRLGTSVLTNASATLSVGFPYAADGANYWSSTAVDGSNGWRVALPGGAQDSQPKNSAQRVILVRP